MAACLIVAGQILSLTMASFTLSWTHSVEKTSWQETWRIEPDQLILTAAKVKGSGAGMDPGEGAVLQDGWWVWTPQPVAVPNLHLAASGATGGGWTMCFDDQCTEIGTAPSNHPAIIQPCDAAQK